MISANTGEPEKELAKIASGGELSRVMLAIKTILCGTQEAQNAASGVNTGRRPWFLTRLTPA
jgi:DNA repair protein RecN (Recombination protein N)